MKWVGRAAWLALWVASFQGPVAVAQETVPSGPAELIKRANEGRARAEQDRAQKVGEAAAKADDPQAAAPNEPVDAADPHGPDGASPHGDAAANPHGALKEPTLPASVTDPALPVGTIRVQVRDAQGEPAAGAQVLLGVMASMGARSQKPAQTDAEGQATFSELPTGSQQAYRVNVLSGGAKFSSTPFRLGESAGERVEISLRPTTQDKRFVVQLIGQTVVELRDDRLHITQQARIANAGQSVFVFPEGGMIVPLPEGFTAFQWQDQMTDQHAEEAQGSGFRLRGSLLPGSTTLGWSFDLPREGDSAKIAVSMPFRTYTYRVITEAPESLKLRVSGFPEPEKIEDKGRKLLFTQVRKQASEPLLGDFSIRISGIPSPGPGRWVALSLALFCALAGLLVAVRREDDADDRRLALRAHRESLLAEVRALEEDFKAGEVGPEFRARRLEELTMRMAMVMRDEEALEQRSESGKRRGRTHAQARARS